MKFVIITKDAEVEKSAKEGFHPTDQCCCYGDWKEALENCEGADLLFVDLIATLVDKGKIAGYETFAEGKMTHTIAGPIPLVLISPPEDYELDFMAGWPDFVFAHIQRPVSYKIFRRASTWV